MQIVNGINYKFTGRFKRKVGKKTKRKKCKIEMHESLTHHFTIKYVDC